MQIEYIGIHNWRYSMNPFGIIGVAVAVATLGKDGKKPKGPIVTIKLLLWVIAVMLFFLGGMFVLHYLFPFKG